MIDHSACKTPVLERMGSRCRTSRRPGERSSGSRLALATTFAFGTGLHSRHAISTRSRSGDRVRPAGPLGAGASHPRLGQQAPRLSLSSPSGHRAGGLVGVPDGRQARACEVVAVGLALRLRERQRGVSGGRSSLQTPARSKRKCGRTPGPLSVWTNSSGAAARARPLHRPGIAQVDATRRARGGSSQLLCEAKQQRPPTAPCLLRLAAAAVSKRRR